MRQEHISYPVVRDVSGNFVRSFGTTGVPETFVINRQGKIAALRRFQVDTKWLDPTCPRSSSSRRETPPRLDSRGRGAGHAGAADRRGGRQVRHLAPR